MPRSSLEAVPAVDASGLKKKYGGEGRSALDLATLAGLKDCGGWGEKADAQDADLDRVPSRLRGAARVSNLEDAIRLSTEGGALEDAMVAIFAAVRSAAMASHESHLVRAGLLAILKESSPGVALIEYREQPGSSL